MSELAQWHLQEGGIVFRHLSEALAHQVGQLVRGLCIDVAGPVGGVDIFPEAREVLPAPSTDDGSLNGGSGCFFSWRPYPPGTDKTDKRASVGFVSDPTWVS